MLIVGVMSLSSTFPFALGLSIRRKDFYLGTVLMTVFATAVVSVVLFLFNVFEQQTNNWGIQLQYFNLPYLNDGTVPKQLLTNFIIALYMYFIGFTITSIQKRFGKIGLFIFSCLMVILLSVLLFLCNHLGWWTHIFHWFGTHSIYDLSIWSLIFLAVNLIASYLLIRKSTV